MILSLVSTGLTFVTGITVIFLQLEKRKLRHLNLKLDKLNQEKIDFKRRLGNALNAIEGYHKIEEFLAEKQELDVTVYRKRVRAESKVKGAIHEIVDKLVNVLRDFFGEAVLIGRLSELINRANNRISLRQLAQIICRDLNLCPTN